MFTPQARSLQNPHSLLFMSIKKKSKERENGKIEFQLVINIPNVLHFPNYKSWFQRPFKIFCKSGSL